MICSKCEFVVLPKYADKIRGKEQEFCPRCECKYENRNTSVIKVVVVMVIWVISLLVVYMLFLILLEPLLNKRVKGNYQEHTNEDVSEGLTMSLLEHVDRDDAHHDEPSTSSHFFAQYRRRPNRLPSGYDEASADDDDVSRYGTSDDDDDSNRSISLFDAKDDVTLGANDIGALAASSSGMSSAAAGATGGNHAAAAAAATSAAAADYHAPAGSGALPMGARGNVLNRVGHQQDKWKRQVREQRKNIYDRHTMLN